jgi:hypothetical protein
MKSFKTFISIVFAFQGILASLDCKKWWDNRNSQLLVNQYRTMAINCSKYIQDCGSYDKCVSDRPSDKNGCECFFNQKQPSEKF